MNQGIGLADVGQEAVAQALSLLGPRDRPAMSWKSIVSRTISEAPTVAATSSSRPVADGHDGHVRLDRRERIVGRLGPRLSLGR